MKRRVLLRRAGAPLGGAAAILALAGCGGVSRAGSGRGPREEAEVPRIPVGEAWRRLQAGQAVAVDVRPRDAYQRQRIAGAVSLPLEEIEAQPRTAVARLPRDKHAVLY